MWQVFTRILPTGRPGRSAAKWCPRAWPVRTRDGESTAARRDPVGSGYVLAGPRRTQRIMDDEVQTAGGLVPIRSGTRLRSGFAPA